LKKISTLGKKFQLLKKISTLEKKNKISGQQQLLFLRLHIFFFKFPDLKIS